MESSFGTASIRVAGELRRLILSGSLAPSSRLGADFLAQRMGTSRTPVREALLLLEREGLVENLPNRGAVVRSFDASDLLDLYEVRSVIEPLAALRAAERAGPADLEALATICDEAERLDMEDPDGVHRQIECNQRFHGMIAKLADSERLLEALRGTAGIPLMFRTVFWANIDQCERSLAFHREIFWAIEKGDPDLAASAMSTHMKQAQRFLRVLIAGGGLPEVTPPPSG